jgi:hypothetical protein
VGGPFGGPVKGNAEYFARAEGPPPRELLRSIVTYLGEVGDIALYLPEESRFGEDPGYYGKDFKAGHVLCCTSDGREAYILRPRGNAGAANRRQLQTRQAVHARDLHERFMGRRASEYYNLIVQQFRKPRYVGDLAILHYFADKDLGDGQEGLVEWVHFFEGPDGPAYPPLFSVGHGQFYIPRGAWHVGPQGIDYFDEATGQGGIQ